MSHLTGKSREQIRMPSSIEEYVEEYSPVRIIDAFVDTLDMKELGFTKATPAYTGRPAYAPSDLLKLYIYGYMNKMRSSRRLMTECRRNMEVMFLLNELKPDFRTISDFRKENPEPIREVFREFVKFCDEFGLFKKELIAIDGTKVRAQNSDDKCYNKDILLKKIERIDAHIEEYIGALKRNDESGEDDDDEDDRKPGLEEIKTGLKTLSERKDKYVGYLTHLNSSEDTQILETDPEAHRMHTNNGFHCCYNIQTAVDSGSHLIAEYEVTSHNTDQGLLNEICEQAKGTLCLETIEAVADKGYESRNDILNCIMNGTVPNVGLKYDRDERIFNLEYEETANVEDLKNSTTPEDIAKCIRAGVLPNCYEGTAVSVELQELSALSCFIRNDNDTVTCPMGVTLTKLKTKGQNTEYANKDACRQCKNRCTDSATNKRVSFGPEAKYVAVLMYGSPRHNLNEIPDDFVCHNSFNRKDKQKKRVVIRLREDKEKLKRRMCTVEHPFGSVKWYGDAGYVLCRGKRKVSAEIGLSFLGYNIKRAIKMIGTEELLKKLGA